MNGRINTFTISLTRVINISFYEVSSNVITDNPMK